MVQWIVYQIEAPEALGIALAVLTVLYIVWSCFTVPGGYRVMSRQERRAEAQFWSAYLERQRRVSGGGRPWNGGDGGGDGSDGGGGGE